MWKKLLSAAAFAGLISVSLNASTLGTFNLGGDIFVNGTSTIHWSDEDGVANKATVSEATGIYTVANGQEVTIDDLVSATEPTGTPFPDTLFIIFPAADMLNPLQINMIYAGIDGSAGCAAPPSAGPPPQVCTPPLPGGAVSPFNLENNPPQNNITSTASFAFSGNLGGATTDTWFANFTSQFNVPFQTVLAQLGPGGSGSVTNAYSATFTVAAPNATPETSSLSMLALGLGLVLLARFSGLVSRIRRHQ